MHRPTLPPHSRSHPHRPILLLAALLASCSIARAGRVPLRVDLPAGAGDSRTPVPVGGGVPFPQGQLRSTDNVRLLDAGGTEVPCQVTRTAVWPDGSVKWAMVDAVLPGGGDPGTLEFGDGVRRAAIPDAIAASADGGAVTVAGGGVSAVVRKDGGGVIDELSISGEKIVTAGRPARLVIQTLRLSEKAAATGLATNEITCRDPDAVAETGTVQVEELAVESPGPVRATVRVRGFVLLPHLGATLPEAVKTLEPAGRLPFSLRLSFFRQSGVVLGQHQIVFTGEPDLDFITRWGIELPVPTLGRGALVVEPGVTLWPYGNDGGAAGPVAPPAVQAERLCWAPLQGGLALIRKGWENRPCGITPESRPVPGPAGGKRPTFEGSSRLEFWPASAGPWDLRRYAREWATGESGNTRDPGEIEHFARYAARGMAKSHDFVLAFAQAGSGKAASGAAPAEVRALSGRGLLVAPPRWYADTRALGAFAPEASAGDFAPADAETCRDIAYHLFNQDLFNWYGKLTFGYWQSRFGQVHRTDRWDNDYGRWGWSLADGGGRVGHVLMLQYLRTLDRRYFEAGEAFNRESYDTNLVHTLQHLENSKGWWTVRGCAHRHNVQPFGCPYIGLRGAYPAGQRIFHLLTGDAVIADGLDLVADASFQYARGSTSRLGNSGGSDGQGAAANALLWKYETTGDDQYLKACRTVLDKTGLIPPKAAKDLEYGPSFGVFNAAGEYADLTGDNAFRERVVDVARMGAAEKEPGGFLFAMAAGYRYSNDGKLRSALESAVGKFTGPNGESMEDLPPDRWPGHAGWRTPTFDVNAARDLPYAMAALAGAGTEPTRPLPADLPWPAASRPARALPATVPSDGFHPGGAPAPGEQPPISGMTDAMAAPPVAGGDAGGQTLAAGPAVWTFRRNWDGRSPVPQTEPAPPGEGAAGGPAVNAVRVHEASPLAGAVVAYADVVSSDGGEGGGPRRFQTLTGTDAHTRAGPDGSVLIVSRSGPALFWLRWRPALADGVPSVRVEARCQISRPDTRVTSWGLIVPLKPGPDAHAVQVTTPGGFRLERCRLDQSDERVPAWLSSEYHWPDGTSLWPRWRLAGIEVGPSTAYRDWRANREDTSPLFTDQGDCPDGACCWLDLTDRGAAPRWGVTARLLRPGPPGSSADRQAIRANLETGELRLQFQSPAATSDFGNPVEARIGAADLIFHDGWRPPLSKPELTAGQYEKFIDDLNYGENYGLLALRFNLSLTHKVPAGEGRRYAGRVRDLGIEPREILYGMQYGNALAGHCKRLGTKWDASDVEGSVRRVVEHYQK